MEVRAGEAEGGEGGDALQNLPPECRDELRGQRRAAEAVGRRLGTRRAKGWGETAGGRAARDELQRSLDVRRAFLPSLLRRLLISREGRVGAPTILCDCFYSRSSNKQNNWKRK